MQALVFSKNRPLQLQAYVESLHYASQLPHEDINILIDSRRHYEPLIERFKCNWIVEEESGGFYESLKAFLLDYDLKYLLFGCDDVIYINSFSFIDIYNGLNDEKKIGFSLRLGNNIPPRMASKGKFVTWGWPGSPGHWGYPFELMASVYKTDLVREILSVHGDKVKTPNYLESFGTQYCWQTKFASHPWLTRFNCDGKAVAQDVNRVQSDFPNQFGGGAEQDPDYLIGQYNLGKRLNWQNAWASENDDVFVGNKYWKYR